MLLVIHFSLWLYTRGAIAKEMIYQHTSLSENVREKHQLPLPYLRGMTTMTPMEALSCCLASNQLSAASRWCHKRRGATISTKITTAPAFRKPHAIQAKARRGLLTPSLISVLT